VTVWFRFGPFGVSSRGRASVGVGPVTVTGGGRRRASSSPGVGRVLFGVLLLITLVWLGVAALWSWSPGGTILIFLAVPTLIVLWLRRWWKNEVEKARRALEEQEVAREHARSLHAKLPARVTDSWISETVPLLPAEEVPYLVNELRRRGWTWEALDYRLMPFVGRSPLAEAPPESAATPSISAESTEQRTGRERRPRSESRRGIHAARQSSRACCAPAAPAPSMLTPRRVLRFRAAC
jgi:hypothetical protein